MMIQPAPKYSFEDYLAVEREAIGEKYEYLDGQVFAMTGGSYNHSLIIANLAGELHQGLRRGPCVVLSSDMRLRVDAANACLYPDVTVVCGEPGFHDDRRDVLTNPILVAEVLSPSTEAYDRGDKLALYRQIASLRTVLLVAQDRVSIDLFTRQTDERWVLETFTSSDATIRFNQPDCAVALSDVYDRVNFIANGSQRCGQGARHPGETKPSTRGR